MIPRDLRERLAARVAAAEHPRQETVEVLFALQEHYGWLPDEAVAEAAALLGMTPLEVDEVATFYTFLYRRPVGRYVLHACDSVVCEMAGGASLREWLVERLGVGFGGTTSDGLFTLLPVCCVGYCDRAPALLVNLRVHGELTPERLDALLAELRQEAAP